MFVRHPSESWMTILLAVKQRLRVPLRSIRASRFAVKKALRSSKATSLGRHPGAVEEVDAPSIVVLAEHCRLQPGQFFLARGILQETTVDVGDPGGLAIDVDLGFRHFPHVDLACGMGVLMNAISSSPLMRMPPSNDVGPTGQGWGAAMWESANLRVHLTGKVILTIGTQSHGQGHETTMAQIVSEELGIPMDDIIVQLGDTLGTPFGYGSYASRSAAVGGMAVYNSAQKIKEKAKRLAAHLLEAAPEDMTFESGKAFVKGSPDKAKTIQELAGAAALAYSLPAGMEPFLDDVTYYDPPECTYPFGTHICVVEVDKETGQVKILRYIAVDDVGKRINPLIVEGQIHGGIVQGVGQALWEGAVYDENAQLLSGSMMDYAVPKASFLPKIELESTETPSPTNPMGVKGVGETGTIASTPAVVNAVMDALSPFGIKHLDMPLTPEKVWRAMPAAEMS